MNKLEREFLNSKIKIVEPKTWQQELAEQKFEYQKEQNARKEAERLRTENQKRSAQNTKVIMQVITIILKICFYIIFLPILAIGFFFIGFLKAVMK